MLFNLIHLVRVLSAWLYCHVRLNLSRLHFSCFFSDCLVFIHVQHSVSSVLTYIINGNYM